jgi:hypothetical protein
MIAHADRIKAVTLILKAVRAGASKSKACTELGLSIRTYRRWHSAGVVKTDGRTGAQKRKPANAFPGFVPLNPLLHFTRELDNRRSIVDALIPNNH